MQFRPTLIALAAAIVFLSAPGLAAAETCAGIDGSACTSDHNPCTSDLCQSGTCVHANLAAATPCDEGNVCTDGACDGAGTCVTTNNSNSCDDGDDYCTAVDTCSGGHCVGQASICTEVDGAGKNGGFFRIKYPTTWDGDLVIYNHGFDLNDKHIRGQGICGNDPSRAATCTNKWDCCDNDFDCSDSDDFCNGISLGGVDQILLGQGKAVAAGTYSDSGWAVFHSSKDIKDIIDSVKKDPVRKLQLKRVIVTGHSGGGAVTGEAILKMKIHGAVPQCAAVGGGLPTWDVAQDVRLVYDFLCNGVSGAKFGASIPDVGVPNTADASNDSLGVAAKTDACFGVIGIFPHTPEQDTRLAQFLALTQFSGYQGPSAGINVASAIGFATIGLGDFVQDPRRLKGKRIGLNDTIDYTTLGVDAPLAADFEADVYRMTKGNGRSTLKKYSNPDFTKGSGKKLAYPILSMAGSNDWLVLPEFERVFDTALTSGAKPFTQTWVETFGHCVFTREETEAVFNEYFDWIGNVAGDAAGTQPTRADVSAECIAVGGVDGDTCNFDEAFEPGHLADRIPARADWPVAATTTAP